MDPRFRSEQGVLEIQNALLGKIHSIPIDNDAIFNEGQVANMAKQVKDSIYEYEKDQLEGLKTLLTKRFKEHFGSEEEIIAFNNGLEVWNDQTRTLFDSFKDYNSTIQRMFDGMSNAVLDYVNNNLAEGGEPLIFGGTEPSLMEIIDEQVQLPSGILEVFTEAMANGMMKLGHDAKISGKDYLSIYIEDVSTRSIGELKKMSGGSRGIALKGKSGSEVLLKQIGLTLRWDGDRRLSINFRGRKTDSKLEKIIYDYIISQNPQVFGSKTSSSPLSATQQYLENKVKTTISDSKISSSLIKNLSLIGGAIAINSSSSAITGALGEWYWLSFFDYLALLSPLLKKEVAAAGVKLKSTKGQEVPIDIIYGALGVQVKNYTPKNVKNQSFKFLRPTDKIPLDTFLSGQGFGRLGEPELVPVFGDFFFSKYYNIPINTEFDKTAARFQIVQDGIRTYIESSIAQLMNLNKSSIEISEESKQYFAVEENIDVNSIIAGIPDVFIIGKNFIFSYTLVDEILKSISAQDGTVTLRVVGYDMSGADAAYSAYVQTKYPNENNSDPRGAMHSASFSYALEVEVGRLPSIRESIQELMSL